MERLERMEVLVAAIVDLATAAIADGSRLWLTRARDGWAAGLVPTHAERTTSGPDPARVLRDLLARPAVTESDRRAHGVPVGARETLDAVAFLAELLERVDERPDVGIDFRPFEMEHRRWRIRLDAAGHQESYLRAPSLNDALILGIGHFGP